MSFDLLFIDQPIDFEDDQWADINIVSGCLKLYLRELPDPLIPFRMFRGCIDAASKLYACTRTCCMRQMIVRTYHVA